MSKLQTPSEEQYEVTKVKKEALGRTYNRRIRDT